jgi:hypothetical protein
MASSVPEQVKSEALGPSSITALSTSIQPTNIVDTITNTNNASTSLPHQTKKEDSPIQVTSLKPDADIGGSSIISAPTIPTKMEGIVGMSNESDLSESYTSAIDIDTVPIKEGMTNMATTKADDSPPSTTQADFDADPALWGLRRSGRAPKKVYVDSSAGEGSDDDVTFTGSKMRSKNGKGRGESFNDVNAKFDQG